MIKKVVFIAVNALCMIAFIICLVLTASIKASLRSQQATAAWAGQSGERFAQLSVFIPESGMFIEENIYNLHSDIDSALLSASLESVPGRTLYTDAWSAAYDVFVIGEHGTAAAKAIGVGGDFFMFHPLYLRDGSYLHPDDLMKDRVVIDEELAWRLFGSARLAGFEIMIDNRPFIISGVVSRESDFASSRAYSDGAGLFMSYEALMALSYDDLTVSCYEIVMPDPITGFALRTLTDAFPEESVHIVENSARFTLADSFAVIGSFGERSLRTEAIAYPYWENAARFAEDWLALLLVLSLLFVAFPLVCFVFYSIRIIHLVVKRGKKTVDVVVKKHDDRQYEKYLLEHDGEHHIYDVNDIIREVQDGNS